MALRLITPPATYPVSLAEVQAHCNAPESDFEMLLHLYLKAATEDAEKFTGRSFIDQRWDYYVDAFPDDDGALSIPRPPLIDIEGIYTRAAGGDEELLDASFYSADIASEPGRIVPAFGSSWPTLNEFANAVRVRFRSGYVDNDPSPTSGVVPFAIKAAILLTTGTLFAHRETIVVGQTATMLPWAAQQLLRPYRVEKAFA